MSKLPFVADLANINKFNEAIGSLMSKTTGNANFGLVYGEPGLGKTETIINRSAKDGHPMIRAKRAWSIRWMLTELSDALGLPVSGRTQVLYGQIKDELMRREIVVYIDELDHVISNKDLIETLRDLSDESGAKIVLIGMQDVSNELKRYPVLESRISATVKFAPLTEIDVATVIQAALPPKGDGEHDRDALRMIHNLTKGNFRRLSDLIDKLSTQMKVKKTGHLTLGLVREAADLKGLK